MAPEVQEEQEASEQDKKEEKKEEKHEDAESRGEAERRAQEVQIAADNQRRQIRMGVIEDPDNPTEPEPKEEESQEEESQKKEEESKEPTPVKTEEKAAAKPRSGSRKK